MICKFFKSQTGGGVSSVNYILNERVNQGTARILKGDEFLTRELIKSMIQKHKTCVGCLSFEEKNIDEDLKKEIMESFENALLTPAMQGRYNILWIEHTDKGRLELNFIIPKFDLESKKAFNPYYHPADNKRIDLWRDFVNLKYGFTNPKDPAKEQTIQGSKKAKELFKDYESLDKILHKQVADEVINSRDELISFLELNNIEVTRKGKDYLSIKLPESKKAKRFKGSIYDEQFGSTQELREIRREKESRAREYQQRDIKQEFERINNELNKCVQSKCGFYEEAIRRHELILQTRDKRPHKNNEGVRRIPRKTDNEVDRDDRKQHELIESKTFSHRNELSSWNAYDDDFTRDCVVSMDKTLSNQQEFNNERQRRENFSLLTERTSRRKSGLLLPADELKEDYDNIRDRINSRNREITGQDNRISTSRNEIARDNKERENSIRERFGSYEKQAKWLNAEFQGLERENTRERTKIQRIREFFETGYTEFRNRFESIFKRRRMREMLRISRSNRTTKKRDFGMER